MSKVFEYNHTLRVRYAETDQMGFVYYGNYATYFEVARVEALRSTGVTYKKLEEEGILLPVVGFSIKYYKPARYDELITVKVKVHSPAVRFHMEYETLNEEGETLNHAKTTLVFVDKTSMKPCSVPDWINQKLEEYF